MALDATLSQQHGKSVELTKFPIETGATPSDHAIRRPDSYRLDGIVTNAPLEKPEDIESGRFIGRAETARGLLESIVEARSPLTIDTGSKVHEMMMMVDLQFSKDNSAGDCTKFSAAFEKVVQVDSETVALPRSTKPGVSRGGKKPTTKAPEPVKKRVSVLQQMVKKIRGQ